MTEREKMLAGQLYDAGDAELKALRVQAREKIFAFNQERDQDKRKKLIQSWFGSCGQELLIEPRFVCDYGVNIHVGEYFYANFNCTMLDVCEIRIGDHALIGPNVQLLTPLHPLDAQERTAGQEYGAPITIGNNVWIGGGAIILPGVTLGDNVVVGAGSVVTKSFGDNVVIAGNPAKVIKVLEK